MSLNTWNPYSSITRLAGNVMYLMTCEGLYAKLIFNVEDWIC